MKTTSLQYLLRVVIFASCSYAILGSSSQGEEHAKLKKGIEEIKTRLALPLSISEANKNIGPQYKRKLNLLGSWFMGDQISEHSVSDAVSIPDLSPIDLLYDLHPYLKNLEQVMDESKSEKLKNNFKSSTVSNQAQVVENALHIHEVLTKLADPELAEATKKDLIISLNKQIFDTVLAEEEVLIPVVWLGTQPGGVLISLKKLNNYSQEFRIRIFDTEFMYRSNFNKEQATSLDKYSDQVAKVSYANTNFLIRLFGVVGLNKYGANRIFESGAFNPIAVQDANLKAQLNKLYESPDGSQSKIRKELINNYLVEYQKFFNELKLRVRYFDFSDSESRVREELNNSIDNHPKIEFEKLLKAYQRVLKALYGEEFNLSGKSKSNYPIMKIPFKEVRASLKAFENSGALITGLLQLRNHTELMRYMKMEAFFADFLEWVISFLPFSSTSRLNHNLGMRYFYNEIVPRWGKHLDLFEMRKDPSIRAWPFNRSAIGPLGTIQAYFTTTVDANDDKLYHSWKLRMGMGIIKHFLSRFASDTDIHIQTRNDIVIHEISKRAAGRLLQDAVELAQVEGWIPEQTGADKEQFWDYIHAVFKKEYSQQNGENEDELLKKEKVNLFARVIKTRNALLQWIQKQALDNSNLEKINRSAYQREIPMKQRTTFSIESTIEDSVDITEFRSRGHGTVDMTNCMSGIGVKVNGIHSFIKAFENFSSVYWKWTSFRFDIKNPECRPYFRRNAEIILRNMEIGGTDEESLQRWTPHSIGHYKQFKMIFNECVNSVSGTPNSARTLEDYIILFRLQRVIWRVVQAMDTAFIQKDPKRHLDLAKYSLAFPQCRRMLKDQMSYSNIFLADSGAYSNILNPNSVLEIRDLCKELVDEEVDGKTVLNYDKYVSVTSFLYDRMVFDRVDLGDREIYVKMAQNPYISRVIKESRTNYDFGSKSLLGDSARAAAIGEAGSQMIYYHFFDALKYVFVSNMATESVLQVPNYLEFPLVNLRVGMFNFVTPPFASFFPAFSSFTENTYKLPSANVEIVKNVKKSYLKISVSEMLRSHVLGLDVMMNHLSKGSHLFWSSGSVIPDEDEDIWSWVKKLERDYGGLFEKYYEKVMKFINNVNFDFKSSGNPAQLFEQAMAIFSDSDEGETEKKFKIKRNNVAGTADFLLNCSAHLLRKLDVSPGYDEVVMTMLMNAFKSADSQLFTKLKDIYDKNEGTEEAKNQISKPETTDSKQSVNNLDLLHLKGKTNINDLLRALINWGTLSIRFASRVRSMKPEWKDKYNDVHLHIYSAMFKYSRIKPANMKLIIPLQKQILVQADYLIYMILSLNVQDASLTSLVYANMKSIDSELPADTSVLPAALLMHRFVALRDYRKQKNLHLPITDDFIQHQFGIGEVMNILAHLSTQNESFLKIMAQFMSPYLAISSQEVLKQHPQSVSMIRIGALKYGPYGINLIQSVFTFEGQEVRDLNAVLQFPLFNTFFSSGSDIISLKFGLNTIGCENRFQVDDYLISKSRYSICHDVDAGKITIYRDIKKFPKPCILVVQKSIAYSLQEVFSIYGTEGLDLYACVRGNNKHFVWIRRDSHEPEYITHGRFWNMHNFVTDMYLNAKYGIKNNRIVTAMKFESYVEPKIRSSRDSVDLEPSIYDRFLLPTFFFPKVQISSISPNSLLPLTAETRQQVISEPISRFAGGMAFGSYILNSQMFLFFQNFRFRDNLDQPLAFFEDEHGTLSMKGRSDLVVCPDQIFEDNFSPALMMQKTDDLNSRIAFVPIFDPTQKSSSALNAYLEGKKIDVFIKPKDDEDDDDLSNESSKDKENGENETVFMEAIPVERVIDSNGNGSYRLKPTSRLQRILLSYHNLRRRNYDTSLRLINPRSGVDHNTPLLAEEIQTLSWMVKMMSAEEPEALALRLIAKMHLIIDNEQFPKPAEEKRGDGGGGFGGRSDLPKEFVNLPFGKLGRYFVVSPTLPKRFQIDHVFSDAMSSRFIQLALQQEYNEGLVFPGKENLDFSKIAKEMSGCKYDSYINEKNWYAELYENMFVPLSVAEEKNLQDRIEKRHTSSYIKSDCEIFRIVVQKLIELHKSNANIHIPIPIGLQELIVNLHTLMTNLNGNSNTMKDFMLSLGHPDALYSQRLMDIRNSIDSDKIKAHFYKTPNNPLNLNPATPPPPPPVTLSRFFELCRERLEIHQSSNTQSCDSIYESCKQSDKDLMRNIIPSSPSAEIASKSRDINTLRFSKEDLNFIDNEDDSLYLSVRNIIDAARKEKDPIHRPVREVDENGKEKEDKMKTLKALNVAITEYLTERKEVVIFDKLVEDGTNANVFKELSDHVDKKLKKLDIILNSLRNRYKNSFSPTNDPTALNIQTLTSLRRLFNNDRIPDMAELRDCFMKMSISCIKDRLPEMVDIHKVVELVKHFYIRTILYNNYTSISRKISEFNRLASLASKATLELSTTADPIERENLDREIFGHKDTALLQVEDIYIDMDKLRQLEYRLQDPVIMNFEFMSSRYHLTKEQVSDVASLSQRNWEIKLAKKVSTAFITIKSVVIAAINEFDTVLKSEKNQAHIKEAKERKNQVIEEAVKSINTGEDTIKIQDIVRKWIKIYNRIKSKKDLIKNDGVVKSAKAVDQDEDSEMDADVLDIIRLNAYLPQQDRKFRRSEFDKTIVKKNRPALDEFSRVGELLPFDPEDDLYVSKVIQRKMAAGKTTVLGTAATCKKSDGRTLSVLVLISSLYQSSAPEMQKRTSDFFDTRGFTFTMPKPRLTVPNPSMDKTFPARNFLEWTLKSIITTINTRSYLITTPETLQAFLNSYVEFLEAFVNTTAGKKNSELGRCLHLFATIYEIFRTRGSLILDEIDSAMRPQKELNFPTTEREPINIKGVELTADLIQFSALNDEIKKKGLRLLDNQQATLKLDQFENVKLQWREYVLKQLNEKTSIWYTIFMASEKKVYDADKLVQFFFDPSPLDKSESITKQRLKNDVQINSELNFMASVRKGNVETFNVMMIIKMQIKRWLKECFNGTVNEHYGPSLQSSLAIKYAIPYLFANTPAEGSIFADRWETVNKTLMMYLVKKLSRRELSLIIFELRDLIQESDVDQDINFIFKRACPGHDIMSLKFDSRNLILDNDGAIAKCMSSKSDSAIKLIFLWITKKIFEKESFYSKQITSNAINLTKMFSSVQGYSGTIDNVNVLPHQVMIDAEMDHRKNELANGAITSKLYDQKDCVTIVPKFEELKEIRVILDAMCIDFASDLTRFSAFIDVGALLKDFTNETVALALAKKFKRKIVLYYNEKSNELFFLSYDSATDSVTKKALESSETETVNRITGSQVKDRFTYYDQRHITGSDILQPPTAKAFLTIGPKVLLRDILQGVMRMRQFQSGQSIHFITTSAVEDLLKDSCDDLKSGAPLDQRHLVKLGALKEDEKQLGENVRLYRVKIDAELRTFVLDIISDALAQGNPTEHQYRGSFNDEHEDLFKSAISLFIRNVRENPIIWATINIQQDTHTTIKNYIESRENLIPYEWKNYREVEKWTAVKNNLDVLSEKLDVEKKNDVRYARSLLNYLGDTIETAIVSDKFKVAERIDSIDQGSTVEMELQMELQQEVQLELQQIISVEAGVSPIPDPKMKIELPPEPKFDDSNWLSNMFTSSSTSSQSSSTKTPPKNAFDTIQNTIALHTPWDLFARYAYYGDSKLPGMFKLNLFCSGLCDETNESTCVKLQRIRDYCQNGRGFVGISAGLAKTCSSISFDFDTPYAREGSHLIFWRGRSDADHEFHYAVFLISSCEAIDLHASWNYNSSAHSLNESFWLTDLLGFEVHGTPFAQMSYSSPAFSLFEKLYEDKFEEIHFNALVLNGSYNTIMSSEKMFERFRKWLGEGDKSLTADQVKSRSQYFLYRISCLSKLRDEIVPDENMITLLSNLTAGKKVDFNLITNDFKAQFDRKQMKTYDQYHDLFSKSVEKVDWKPSRNIIANSEFNFFLLLSPEKIALICLTLLIISLSIWLLWGKASEVSWSEHLKSKFVLKKMEGLSEENENENENALIETNNDTSDSDGNESTITDDSNTEVEEIASE